VSVAERPFADKERLERMRSIVLEEPTSTLDFPAQQDLLREAFRLREALERVLLWLPAASAAMSDEDWLIWLLVERALRGEAELPFYVGGERRRAILELDEIVNRTPS
jgi:hypothetical protein